MDTKHLFTEEESDYLCTQISNDMTETENITEDFKVFLQVLIHKVRGLTKDE